MEAYLAEFIGTSILLLLGNGVVANVVLDKTNGQNSDLIVIGFGWAIAVFAGVFVCTSIGGPGHLNPAVTIGAALTGAGGFTWALVPGFIAAQMLGAMVGTTLVYMMYQPHYEATKDAASIKSTFCNAPAISSLVPNLLSEIIGTFVLVYGAFHLMSPVIGGESASLGSIDALPIALVVLGIGLSLGGTTGYAINPARDLGPRIMHAILPITHKGGNGWGYSWIPVVGPIIGGLLAALVKLYIA